MGEKVRDDVGDQKLESKRITKDGKDIAESDSLLGVIVVET